MDATDRHRQKVIGITLARGGSKGVPRKNIRMVAGKPLIAWTIEEALKCEMIGRYIVSTDDAEIAGVAKDYGAEVVLRPSELAQDHTPSRDALLHALEVAEQGDSLYNIVADIRCTNALKTTEDIDDAIDVMLFHPRADVVCGVTQMVDHHPMRLKMMLNDNRLVDIWPENESGNRQELKPPVYIRNGSIYVVRVPALYEGIHFTGGDIRGFVMPLERSINIDSELDLLTTEALLNERLHSG